jgi:hypothetical protein
VLSLLLLQHALAPSSIDAYARSRLPANSPDNPGPDVESRPYLKIAGFLPLRICSATLPPDLVSKPAAGAPPKPSSITPAASTSALPAPATDPAGKPREITPPAQTATVPPTPTINSTPAILPDDTRPATRPEDFLPFFQLPAANQDATGVAPTINRPPAPGQLPPSSATYQQK